MTAKSKIDRDTPIEELVMESGNDRKPRTGTEIQSNKNGGMTEAMSDALVEQDEHDSPPASDETSVRTAPITRTSPSEPSEVPSTTANTAESTDTRTITDTDPTRRTVKQRKSELDEYRRRYMQTPRIEDRKPVFVSRRTRDRLDRIVRLLGDRGMSVSGLIENIAIHHLETHEADIEHWRKMQPSGTVGAMNTLGAQDALSVLRPPTPASTSGTPDEVRSVNT